MNSKSIQNEFQVKRVEDGYKRLFCTPMDETRIFIRAVTGFCIQWRRCSVERRVIGLNAGSRRIVYQKVPGRHSF